MNSAVDSTGLILIALILMAFLFSGDPDVHDHIRRWLDCLTECLPEAEPSHDG